MNEQTVSTPTTLAVSTPTTLDNVVDGFHKMVTRMEADPDYAADLIGPHKGNPITYGEAVISAEEWAEKQVKRASAAAGDWERNVQRPRRDPIKGAIAAAAKRRQKVMESLDTAKWEKAMGKVDETTMYEVIRKRGASAFRAGVEDRAAKVRARVAELQPLVTAVKKQIEAMPDVTDADREARLLAARRLMIEVGKKRRGI